MPFKEKSAWIMVITLLSAGSLYFATVMSMSETSQLPSPSIPLLVSFTIGLTCIAIIGHIVIALISPKEANDKVDERERSIFNRASYLSGNIFGICIFLSLILYLYTRNGDLLFYTAFGSMFAGQLMDYILQIYFYRSAIY